MSEYLPECQNCGETKNLIQFDIEHKFSGDYYFKCEKCCGYKVDQCFVCDKQPKTLLSIVITVEQIKCIRRITNAHVKICPDCKQKYK